MLCESDFALLSRSGFVLYCAAYEVPYCTVRCNILVISIRYVLCWSAFEVLYCTVLCNVLPPCVLLCTALLVVYCTDY